MFACVLFVVASNRKRVVGSGCLFVVGCRLGCRPLCVVWFALFVACCLLSVGCSLVCVIRSVLVVVLFVACRALSVLACCCEVVR